MPEPVLKIPRPAPPVRERPPREDIPATPPEREQMKLQARAYIEANRPVPPLSLEELRQLANRFLAEHGHHPRYRDFAMVLLNGEAWRDQLASVPFSRRLLLLPKCLRAEDRCPAFFDGYGLVCKNCGRCSIQELQTEAERLGYAVLCAEGSALVTAIIQTGKIDAIVGVSCLPVLERTFPYMEAAAIPGVAIPLLQDDCRETTVDIDWVWDVIHLTSDDWTYRLDLDALRREVESWFTMDSLNEILGSAPSQTERIAREWLTKSGKRWRPFLAACACKALAPDPKASLPRGLRHIAIAVECFHKASLIHDDIEDGDAVRYGEKTLHEEHGPPVALNIGDFLLGEGYRLIAESDAPPETRTAMIRAAAQGHRTLCLGQGAELCWARAPKPLTSLEVLEIFRQKTAPAFAVALQLGTLYAGQTGRPNGVDEILTRYSESLGIAYQIRDDLEDLAKGETSCPSSPLRPWLPLAIAHERAKGEARSKTEAAWSGKDGSIDSLRGLLAETGAEPRCHRLLDSFREEAVRSLAELDNPPLKGLLRRVVTKIFGVEIRGWCSEFETRNAAGRETGASSAG